MFENEILKKDIRAFEMPNSPPFKGDIRPTRDYPAGTPWTEITEFEVWDGSAWVKPDAAV